MKRTVAANRKILHPRDSKAKYADELLYKIREYESDGEILSFLQAYIPSDIMIEALEDMADKYQIELISDEDLIVAISEYYNIPERLASARLDTMDPKLIDDIVKWWLNK